MAIIDVMKKFYLMFSDSMVFGDSGQSYYEQESHYHGYKDKCVIHSSSSDRTQSPMSAFRWDLLIFFITKEIYHTLSGLSSRFLWIAEKLSLRAPLPARLPAGRRGRGEAIYFLRLLRSRSLPRAIAKGPLAMTRKWCLSLFIIIFILIPTVAQAADNVFTDRLKGRPGTDVELDTGSMITPYGGIGRYQNLLVQSENLATTWSAPQLTIADGEAAPDGTTNADLLTNSAAAAGTVQQTVTISAAAAATYTFSVWLKAGSSTSAILDITFDGTGPTNGTSGALTLTSNWQRFSVSGTTASNTTSIICKLTNNSTTSGQTARAWGAQVEQVESGVTTPGVYVETKGSAVTASRGLVTNADLRMVNLSIAEDGTLTFGADTNIYRSADNTLKTDDSLNVAGTITTASAGNSTEWNSAYIHSNATGAVHGATASNTPSTIVFRDPSGNFSAGTITANLTGSASNNVLKAGDTMTGSLVFSVVLEDIKTVSNQDLALLPDGTGKVGIGTTAPAQLLQVGADGGGTTAITVTSTGRVGIGSTSPWATLQVGHVAVGSTTRILPAYSAFVKGDFEVDGATYLDGNIAKFGTGGVIDDTSTTYFELAGAAGDYVKIGDNATATSHSGEIKDSNDLLVTGDLEVDGWTYLDGGIDLGDAQADSITVRGTGTFQQTTSFTNITVTGTGSFTAGPVGIGTAAGANLGTNNKLVVSGGAVVGLGYVGTAAPQNGMIIQGNVGIGTTGAQVALHVGVGNTGPEPPGASRPLQASSVFIVGDIEVNGTAYLDGNFKLGTGAAGTLKADVNSDTDPALWIKQSGAGNIAQFIGTGTAMVIEKGGNVGINTASPGAWVDIVGTAGTTALRVLSDGTGAVAQFKYKGTEALFISNTGYVGIGRTAPQVWLHVGVGNTQPGRSLSADSAFVTGNLEVDGTTYLDGAVEVADTKDVRIGNDDWAGRGIANTSDLLVDGNVIVGGTIFGRISAPANSTSTFVNLTVSNSATFTAGPVGIGTGTPATIVHIQSATDPTLTIENTTNTVKMELRSTDTAATVDVSTNHPLTLQTNNLERVRITNAGHVGIGATGATARLVVRDTLTSTTQFTNDSLVILSNADTTANNWTGLYFNDEVGQPGATGIQTKFTDHTNNYGELHFFTRGSGVVGSRLSIDTDGKVGIGTTAPYALLQVGVGNTSHVLQASSAFVKGDVEVDGTAYLDGSVGIGVVNPPERLAIADGGNILLEAGSLITPYGGLGRYQNLLTYSEQFNNAAWSKSVGVGVTADTTAAPDGTTTADTISLGALTTDNISQSGAGATASKAFVGSVWLKATTGTPTINLRLDSGNATGTASTKTLSTNWERFSVSQSFLATSTGGPKLVINNGTTTVIAWGAQIEEASTAGVYVEVGETNVPASRGLVTNADLRMVNLSIAEDGTLTFGADTNIYRSATNTLKTDDSLNVTGNITVGGTGTFTLGPVAIGIATPVAGSQVDIRTGAAGGTQALTIITSGNVGIGTTGPAQLLQVGSGGGGTTAMVVTTRGNVGIGSTGTVSYPLLISRNDSSEINQFLIQQSGSGDASMGFVLDGIGWSIGIDNSDGDKFKIAFDPAQVYLDTALTIDSIGNVGIWTTDPKGTLQVGSGAGGTTAMTVTSRGNVGIGNTGPVQLLQVGGAQGTSVMTVNAIGSIGIGTTSPQASLHIKRPGQTNVRIASGASQFANLWFFTNDTARWAIYKDNTAESGSNVGSDFGIARYDDAGTALSDTFFIKRSTGNVGIGTTNPKQLLQVGSGGGGTTAMTVTSTGNVGIGNTGPGFPLDITTALGNNTHAKFGSSSPIYLVSNNPAVGFNSYWNGSSWIYGSTGYAGVIIFNKDTGEIIFDTAPSGTAGNAATLTQVMTISDNGKFTNIGVGSTTRALKDYSAFVKGDLEVDGTVYLDGKLSGSAGAVPWNIIGASAAETVTLEVEYPGAALKASGSNNSGTLTATNDGDATTPRNYYNWAAPSSQTTQQTYDVYVRYILLRNWSSWDTTGAINIDYQLSSGNAGITAIVQKVGSGTTATITPAYVDTAWKIGNAGISFSSSSLSGLTFTAGSTVLVQIRLKSDSAANARAGTITLNYNR